MDRDKIAPGRPTVDSPTFDLQFLNCMSPVEIEDPPSSTARPAASRSAGLVRLGLLTALALWLTHPFLTGRSIGSGDAWWYANMLRDFLLQLRNGVFPVWTGQTEFAFNGAVYPLRAAPYYQHLGGLLDLLTLRQLDAFALQNLTVVVTALLGVYTAYFALRRLAPERRNAAAVLSALYISCPGVLGLAASMDLHMSHLATPFLPLVTCGLALRLRENGSAGRRMMIIGLALTWYAHAPLAAWLTLITIVAMAIWLARHRRERRAWVEAGVDALWFGCLVAAVFASVAGLRGGDTTGIMPFAIDRTRIVSALREAFPESLLPLRMPATNLGDLQLGYGLWVVLIAGCATALARKPRRLWPLAAAAVSLTILLMPIPGLTAGLWNILPESLASLTYYWPMHRLYPLLAALALPLGMLAFTRAKDHGPQTTRPLSFFIFARASGAALSFLAALAVVWATWQAGRLATTAEIRTVTGQDTVRRRLPENTPLMNHAYGLSTALPPYFSNGVMDPRFELRVLDGTGGREIAQDNARGVMSDGAAAWTDLVATRDANPGVWNLAPEFELQPGKCHLIEFDFAGRQYTGTLQIEGGRFFRQYRLPASGEPLAFGAGESSARHLALWTTSDRPESIRLRFIPDPGAATGRPQPFARCRWHTTDPSSLPLRVDSLMPLRLTAALSEPGLLETFRMHFPGYRARVDGMAAAVERSPSGLVAVSLPAGMHRVEIEYRPPWPLRLALFVSAAAWIALVAFALRRSVESFR